MTGIYEAMSRSFHIWTLDRWETVLDSNRRTGLRCRFASRVNPEIREACLRFVRWLRTEYDFPLRVPIYFKAEAKLRSLDGGRAVGTFFEPNSYSFEPYTRIATGDYDAMKAQIGVDGATKAILLSVAHELTHYYQWINHLGLTQIGAERQATVYSYYVVDDYVAAMHKANST